MNISVKPNPARQWASFEYNLPDEYLTGTITITNSKGEKVEILPVNGQQGQLLWDTRKIPSGLYLYVLKAGNLNQTGKIVINN